MQAGRALRDVLRLGYGATDNLGSTRALTKTDGTVASSLTYDPWGEEVSHTGTNWYNPFQYTGTYLDGDTGMYQMGARYYQPGTGRFTQLDPVNGSNWGGRSYDYTGGNPVNFTDPSGLAHIPGCFGRHDSSWHWWGYRNYMSSCEVNSLLRKLVGGIGASGMILALMAFFPPSYPAIIFTGLAGLLMIWGAARLDSKHAECGDRGLRYDVRWWGGRLTCQWG